MRGIDMDMSDFNIEGSAQAPNGDPADQTVAAEPTEAQAHPKEDVMAGETAVEDNAKVDESVSDTDEDPIENTPAQDMPEAEQSAPKKKKKKKYKGFTFKQRLAMTLLVALISPLTLFVFGPIDLYSANMDEFKFALGDFFGWNILFAVILAAVICAILLPLKKRAFDIAYGIVLWLSVMLFLQGSYLNFGISSLTGDGVGEGAVGLPMLMINTFLWLITGFGCVYAMRFVKRKHRDILRTVALVLCVTVLGMQSVSCGVTLIASDILGGESDAATESVSDAGSEGGAESSLGGGSESESVVDTEGEDITDIIGTPDGKYLLTYANLDKVASKNNIIYFVIDRFDASYYELARQECPEIFYNIDNGGFTYFADHISLYPRTYPSTTYMITGVEPDFESFNRKDYFANAYSTSPFMKLLHDSGYRINLYTADYYAYDNAYYMKEYIANSTGSKGYTIDSSISLAADMTRLSLYRYLPMAAKALVGELSTPDFNDHVIAISDYPAYTCDMKNMYEYLSENPLYVDRNCEKNYSFIHISGTHLPNKYDEDFNELASDSNKKNDAVCAMKQSFKILNLYIDQLKALGVYDDATIIVTGDHGNIKSDRSAKLPHLTSLFVKQSGNGSAALSVSNAPVCHEDIFATILASEGITDTLSIGINVFDVAEDASRERRYIFHRYVPETKKYSEVYIYRITGSARDEDNWKLVDSYDLGKSIYS